MERDQSLIARSIHCPTCGRGAPLIGNPHRPFCALTCRLVDLGVWLDERYRIPGPQIPAEFPDDDTRSTGG